MDLPIKDDPAKSDKKPDVAPDGKIQLKTECLMWVRPTTTIARVIEGCAREKRLDVRQVRILDDVGTRLNGERTVEQCGLHHESALSVVLEQIGGASLNDVRPRTRGFRQVC